MKKQLIAILFSVCVIFFWATGVAAEQDIFTEMNRIHEEAKEAYYEARYQDVLDKWNKGLDWRV